MANSASKVGSLIDRCLGCGSDFGAYSPRPNSDVTVGQCNQCDRRYYIAEDEAVFGSWLPETTALRDFSPPRHLSLQRSSGLSRLIASLPESESDKDKRRAHSRQCLALPLVAVPLDGEFRPIGPALPAASVDISVGGLSFLVQSQQSASFWLLDFSAVGNPGEQAIMKIARMLPHDAVTWSIAGPFVSYLDLPKQAAKIIRSW